MHNAQERSLLKVVFAAFSVLTCLCDVWAVDSVWTWPGDGLGDSVTNMADWTTAANWNNGVPKTADDTASFTKDFTGVKYVRIPTATTLRKLTGVSGSAGFGSANRQIVISDELLTFRPSSVMSYLENIDVYSDVDIPINGAYVSAVTLAGDIRAGELRAGTTLTQRLDLYANQPGGVRSGFLPRDRPVSGSWGDFVVHAPVGTSEAIVGQWTRTAGSKYLLRTGAKHVIPVGTTIHGEGIPEGAWVRRVFTDDTVEISVAATATVEGGDVTFDPMAVNASAYISLASRVGNGDNFIQLNKSRPEDVLRLEIGTLWHNENMLFPFRTAEGFYPGTFVLHNVSVGGKRRLTIYNSHLEFAPTTDGSVPGLPDQGVKMADRNSFARLTVTNNISASIFSISNLAGTVVKDGAGRLQADLSRFASLNTGKLVVEEGEFRFVCGADDCYVKTLAVSNDASVSVSGGDLKVDELIVEPSAKIKVLVADDGSVPTLTVSGAADLSAGGMIMLTGAVQNLAVGTFPILAATPGFDPAVLANWTLVVDGKSHRALSLGVEDGKIVLKSVPFGILLIVR